MAFREHEGVPSSKMRNRHRLRKSDRKLDLSCIKNTDNQWFKGWRLAAFEKVNQKTLALTKSFDASARCKSVFGPSRSVRGAPTCQFRGVERKFATERKIDACEPERT